MLSCSHTVNDVKKVKESYGFSGVAITGTNLTCNSRYTSSRSVILLYTSVKDE